jgi:hypothetical protein
VLGATDDQIIADYVKSDSWHHMALAGIENDSRIATLDRAKFERAPAEAMRHALRVRALCFRGARCGACPALAGRVARPWWLPVPRPTANCAADCLA